MHFKVLLQRNMFAFDCWVLKSDFTTVCSTHITILGLFHLRLHYFITEIVNRFLNAVSSLKPLFSSHRSRQIPLNIQPVWNKLRLTSHKWHDRHSTLSSHLVHICFMRWCNNWQILSDFWFMLHQMLWKTCTCTLHDVMMIQYILMIEQNFSWSKTNGLL